MHAVLRVVKDAGVFEALDACVGLIDGCVGLEGRELGGESGVLVPEDGENPLEIDVELLDVLIAGELLRYVTGICLELDNQHN